MAEFVEYHCYDGLGLAGLVKAGQVTAAERVQEAIRRIDALNPRINAVVTRCTSRRGQL